ncbi:MAG: ABC transporter permease [Clostridia bacterium]|jgi:putative ABC transport system permease protein|nr:ABC transporter permease [Clostridia bacterium]MCI1958096.1 ABC transporter permease [Clostridia bacterium]MCI1999331.1 ABC transporter permease [Clostridia bacterium]MCI2015167.1 ABC transporter permease [Clostridia bacterium]
MGILIGVLEQGLIYSIMALGVYITYKILDFPDLTTDGSFPCGAAVTAVLLMKGVNPYLTTIISFLIGMFIGSLTGIIHVKFKVRDLLSGIIMMTGLYSVNLRITGKANVPLFTQSTVFENSFVNSIFPKALSGYQTVIIAFIIAVIMKVLLDLYLNTKSGFLLRATGNNDTLVTILAKDKGLVKITGLAISNGFIAMGGSMMCQQQRFFDVSMGTGTVVIGLASVIIGTNVFKNVTFVKATTAVMVGAIVYKACVAIAIAMGLSASDMKLITALLFLVILIITIDRKKKVKRNA